MYFYGNKNKEKLIEFPTANLAKSKGFDWITLECFTQEGEEQFSSGDEGDYEMYNFNQYEGFYSRPTQAMLARWLRDVHKIFISSSTPTIKYGTENEFEFEAFRIDTHNHINYNKNEQPKLSKHVWKGVSKYPYIINGLNTYLFFKDIR